MSHDSSLEPTLQAVEPALRLVPERHLWQVLHYLTDTGRALPGDTDLPYWFSRADLLDANVLNAAVLTGTEPLLLLVKDPKDRLIERRSREEQLRVYWRVLFRAAVMGAIDAQLASGALTPEACGERLSRFGAPAAREIRHVLENEHLASPDATDVDRYRMFAAVYLDLDQFTAHAAEEFFPTLPHGRAVRELLSDGFSLLDLVRATRPAGAAEPEREAPPDERWVAPPGAAPAPPTLPSDAPRRLQRAAEAERNGNFVRAAILRAQVADGTKAVGDEVRESSVTGALSALGQLVDRLGDVLDWDPETRQEWRQALAPLLPLAAAGIWPRAARCLYELQRVPAELSREVYAVDLPEAIRTLGKRPVRRHLPHARPVMVLMALHKTHKQMLRAGLSEQAQLRLDRLIHHERHRREHAIGHEFAPIIGRALLDAGLVPTSRVEEVARDKVVAELLDRVCERGFLRLGNLRDAVARNHLKLPDLVGAGEFLKGDPLLRADINLAYTLDGVYRRGEFYLRLIQRLSSLFFGTRWGRLLTLYLLLPFGGAFLVLMSLMEVRHLGGMVAGLVSKSFTPPQRLIGPRPQPGAAAPEPKVQWKFNEVSLEFYEDPVEDPPPHLLDENTFEYVYDETIQERVDVVATVLSSSATDKKNVPRWEFDPNTLEFYEAHGHGPDLITLESMLGLGLFIGLVIHVPLFRRAVFLLAATAWHLVRGVLWDVPHAVWHSRAMRSVRLSGPVRFLYRHFFSPLLLTLLPVGALLILGVPALWLFWWGLILFVTLACFYMTKFGWVVEDRMAEALSDFWRLTRAFLVPGLIAWLIVVFKALANWVERQLYAVDEWMRFRGGDSQGSFAVKALLSLVWFPVAYVTRFAFYLLIEPQVNPVKHFPVVTVGHKVVWPTLPALAEVIGWGPATVVINGCPGIFGFVAWELKENWRLYRANRSRVLKPVMLGSHGESMRGLLRPGFHSGTVPKLRQKMRHALENAETAKAARLHHELDHAAEGVQRFVERELLPLLAGSKEWAGVQVEVGTIKFGCQRVEIELQCPSLGRAPCVIGFENMGGAIEASIPSAGWTVNLTEPQSETLTFALRGLFDMAASARYTGRTRPACDADEQPQEPLARRMAWNEWAERW